MKLERVLTMKIVDNFVHFGMPYYRNGLESERKRSKFTNGFYSPLLALVTVARCARGRLRASDSE